MLEIDITSRKQLDIYMNPQRQRLLKIMEVNAAPMTPKQLSLKLNISSSSVTYHLKKLKELGLVELDHTESIHGIQANFYKKLPVIVNLKGNFQDDLQVEKSLLADYFMNETWTNFKNYLSSMSEEESSDEVIGDCMNGVFYLTDEEAKRLKQMLKEFQENHMKATEGTRAWEVAVIAFPNQN